MESATALKRTPLYEAHVDAGAKLVPFAGWEMPVHTRGSATEHLAVRSGCGVFDVSHMGEIETSGPQALELLQRLLTNDLAKLEVGGAQYSLLCRDDGGVLDDLFTYRLADDRFLTVTNAANHELDLAWFREHAVGFDAEVADRLADWAMLAVQGPEARAIVAGLADGELPTRMRTAAARGRGRRRGARLRHRLHRRGRGRDPDRPCRGGTALGRAARGGRDPCRARRPRHAAARGLLSPLRLRPLHRSQPDRGRARLVLQGGDRVHRRRRGRRGACRGHRREAGAVRAHRRGDPARRATRSSTSPASRRASSPAGPSRPASTAGSGWPTCAPTSPSPAPRSRSTCGESAARARIESKPLYDPERQEP